MYLYLSSHVVVFPLIVTLLSLVFVVAVRGEQYYNGNKEAAGTNEHLYSLRGPRERFNQNFNETCKKYPFVSKFVSMLEPCVDCESRKYLIFVFNINGGLGDRVAGMITALAYAMRTNRTFLVMGDTAFEESFRP